MILQTNSPTVFLGTDTKTINRICIWNYAVGWVFKRTSQETKRYFIRFARILMLPEIVSTDASSKPISKVDLKQQVCLQHFELMLTQSLDLLFRHWHKWKKKWSLWLTFTCIGECAYQMAIVKAEIVSIPDLLNFDIKGLYWHHEVHLVAPYNKECNSLCPYNSYSHSISLVI